VDGLLAAEELRAHLGLGQLPNEGRGDYQTVGGLVMDQLGRIPVEGDRFERDGFSFEVLDMDGPRRQGARREELGSTKPSPRRLFALPNIKLSRVVR